ncbi:unnamed protein product [Lactuca saligna]|uniref:BED-type domain-containing protein n=1 Tax=Lactuca saligna TaxID=75948 RepID=A0AA35VI72_LACSI|nr:unnamed protein product [Lactuca saligna]CAI9272163.1 unnamed protein product [Lactuca saligna]
MKRAKLDKTHNTKKAKLNKTDTHSATVAPQDVELEEEADDIDVVEVDVKVEGEEDHVKMERERWSKVWKYYTRLPIGADGRERAECDKCKKRYICETKNGTGSLRNHIAKCPRRDKSDIAQFSFAKSGGSISINSTVFKPERFRELISEAIVKHDLPFSFREHSDCIREKLHDLFGEYVIESPMAYRASTISTSDSSKSVYKKKDDTTLSKSTREMLQEFTVYETKEFALSQKSQLEMYLDEPRSDEELCLQDLTEDVMKFDNNANGTHEEMESQA